MSIFAFCAFLPREFERNRTLSKKTIYRLRKSLGWCIIKLKIKLRIFLYTPVLCLWSSDHRNSRLHAASRAESGAGEREIRQLRQHAQATRPRVRPVHDRQRRLSSTDPGRDDQSATPMDRLPARTGSGAEGDLQSPQRLRHRRAIPLRCNERNL